MAPGHRITTSLSSLLEDRLFQWNRFIPARSKIHKNPKNRVANTCRHTTYCWGCLLDPASWKESSISCKTSCLEESKKFAARRRLARRFNEWGVWRLGNQTCSNSTGNSGGFQTDRWPIVRDFFPGMSSEVHRVLRRDGVGSLSDASPR